VAEKKRLAQRCPLQMRFFFLFALSLCLFAFAFPCSFFPSSHPSIHLRTLSRSARNARTTARTSAAQGPSSTLRGRKLTTAGTWD
jgi:hypothetical protein